MRAESKSTGGHDTVDFPAESQNLKRETGAGESLPAGDRSDLAVGVKPIPRGPRVVHVATVDSSVRYLILGQLERLRAEGYDVSTVSAPGPNVDFIRSRGFEHWAVRMTRRVTPWSDLRALYQLWRLFRAEGFDIVHTHTPKAAFMGQLAARAAGVPIVVNTVHGFFFDEFTPAAIRALLVALEKLGARCSDTIFSENKEDIATALQLNIAKKAQLRWLSNGVDLDRFDRRRLVPEHQARLRSELNLPSPAPLVGFVGRLVREKGLEDLFAASRIVRATRPDVRYLVAGPPDEAKPDVVYPSHAARFGVQDLFHFTGLRNDLPELYGLMDVFVLPSHREGLPRAPIEACAMGLPCILTNIRGCREVVRDGENGILVPARDPRALAAAILRLVNDAELRETFGRAARRVAELEFDENAVHERVIAEYERLLRQKSR